MDEVSSETETVRWHQDTDAAWSLDESLAIVVLAPASIYDPDRPNFDQRYLDLVEAFQADALIAAQDAIGRDLSAPLRERYRVTPPGTGGMFPFLTDLIQFAPTIQDFMTDLSYWLAIAEFATNLRRLWRSHVRRRNETQNSDGQDEPIFSLSFLKSLCIADAQAVYGISKTPETASSTRNSKYGDEHHPIGSEKHVIALTFGTEIVQTILYVVNSRGRLVEKFSISSNDGISVEVLSLLPLFGS
jgi:hypothetical protein